MMVIRSLLLEYPGDKMAMAVAGGTQMERQNCRDAINRVSTILLLHLWCVNCVAPIASLQFRRSCNQENSRIDSQ